MKYPYNFITVLYLAPAAVLLLTGCSKNIHIDMRPSEQQMCKSLCGYSVWDGKVDDMDCFDECLNKGYYSNYPRR